MASKRYLDRVLGISGLDISRILNITVCEMVLVLEVISTEVTILGWGRGHL